VAFDAVLGELAAEPVDAVVCLGDALQGGPQPAEVLDRLVELGCPVVLGNADAFLLDPDAGAEEPTQQQLEVRAWSNERLGPERLERVRTFEPTVELDLGHGQRLLAFHGSPSSYDDVLTPIQPYDEFRAVLGDVGATVLAGGHVHQQYLRRIDGALMVNPGSVGLSWAWDDPEAFDPFAAYARVTTGPGGLEVAFRRVGLDVEEVVAAIERSGLPHAEPLIEQWRRFRPV
jgi:predicted phosphodiesterase